MSSSQSSLDLLRPKPWASRKRPWASETAKEIEELSRQLITLSSARDWSNPLFQHISPDYHAEFDHAEGVPLNTWIDYIAHHERLANANPEYKFDALDSVADVYEKTGHGSVYMLLRVSGHPRDVVRESIIVMSWQRQGDMWCCNGQRVIRGMLWDA